jgi:hypothetical protein
VYLIVCNCIEISGVPERVSGTGVKLPASDSPLKSHEADLAKRGRSG